MVKNKSFTLLSKSPNKKDKSNTRNVSKEDYTHNVNDKNFIVNNSNFSIEEIDTKEFFDEEEEEKNKIEPGIKKREKKLKNYLSKNSQEIREEILNKVSYKIPKLSFKMKSKD